MSVNGHISTTESSESFYAKNKVTLIVTISVLLSFAIIVTLIYFSTNNIDSVKEQNNQQISLPEDDYSFQEQQYQEQQEQYQEQQEQYQEQQEQYQEQQYQEQQYQDQEQQYQDQEQQYQDQEQQYQEQQEQYQEQQEQYQDQEQQEQNLYQCDECGYVNMGPDTKEQCENCKCVWREDADIKCDIV